MLKSITGPLKKFKFQPQETESLLFYLHYRVTFVILMVCCMLVTSRFFADDRITCTETLEVSSEVISAYCWSQSTYSVTTAYEKKPGKEVPYPGIGTSEDKSEYIYRDYYQWIYLVLFVQGVFFYIPHVVWQSVENGKMKHICRNIANPRRVYSATGDDAQQSKKLTKNDKMLASATFLHKRLGLYNYNALAYFFCEVMAWLNVILQTYFLDSFFQGEFIPLGQTAPKYFYAGHLYDDNPLSWVFPRVTKCHFQRIGAIGKIETVDVMCVLPANALTEKIYLFLWFWFATLFLLSSAGIVLTILTISFPKFRGLRLYNRVASARWPVSHKRGRAALRVGELTGFGDWFVLSVLADRMNAADFEKLLAHLQDKLIQSTKSSKTLNKLPEGETSV